MRHGRHFVLAAFALVAGCAHVTYDGQAAVPKAGPVQVVAAPPSQSHRSLGDIKVEKIVGETLETMVARLGQEGGKRGCDVVLCNVNNSLVDGVQSSERTGVRYFSVGDGNRVPDEVVGECEQLQ